MLKLLYFIVNSTVNFKAYFIFLMLGTITAHKIAENDSSGNVLQTISLDLIHAAITYLSIAEKTET